MSDANMTVVVQIKDQYGQERIQPVNTPGQIFAGMLGQKTLTRQNIKDIKALGFVVEVYRDEVIL